jgi:arginyl-tRNA synthetase
MIISKILEIVNPEDVEFSNIADISFNLKKISRKNKKSEEKIKEEILEKIKEYVKNYEIRNSYLNIFLDWFKLIRDFEVEVPKIKIGKILIEHTSANPNKALHVGHVRNACIGDSLYRFFKILGNEVYVANYIDDTGSQMAELILAFKKLNYPIQTEEKFDKYCSKIYAEVNKLIEKDENLKKEKEKIVKELENENSEIYKFNQEIVKKVLRDQIETLKFLKIHYDFFNKESDVINFGLIEPTLNFLKEKNLSYFSKEKEGCLVVKQNNSELVLIKSDGTLTYLLKDIAYAFWKHKVINKNFLFEKFDEFYITSKNGKVIEKFENFDVSINVIGEEQALNQKFIENLLNSLGKKYIYYSYGLVFLSEKIAKRFGIETKSLKMSGRKGIVVFADELIEKFREEIRKSFKENVDEIVRSCIRYEMLKLDKNKDLIFDFEEALNLKGNSAIYLLYTYARINSILEKSEEKEFKEYELEKEEIDLLRKILEFEITIFQTLRDLRINRFCNYIFNLSQCFNLFYEKCRVLQEEESKKFFRIRILKILKKIYEIIFDILGIEKIKRI